MSQQRIIKETFRTVFRSIDKDTLRWFPGHMSKGLKQMQHKLRSVDCIIEVHDARIPLSGRNPDFKYAVGGIKPHILVLNKFDLISFKSMDEIAKRLKGENVVFTNCKSQQCKGVRKLFPLAQELIAKSDRFNRTSEEDYCVMIIGVANVGKSSLINRLRQRFLHKGNATPVGATPGVTRSVLTKIKISEKPLTYLLDTPGVSTPKIPDIEVGLKLALCNTVQDHLVGNDIIADYLLYWLNKQGNFSYVDYFGLPSASDDILEVLAQIAIKSNRMLRLRDTNGSYVAKPDLNSAAMVMIKAFRNGSFGRIMLDDDLL